MTDRLDPGTTGPVDWECERLRRLPQALYRHDTDTRKVIDNPDTQPGHPTRTDKACGRRNTPS